MASCRRALQPVACASSADSGGRGSPRRPLRVLSAQRCCSALALSPLSLSRAQADGGGTLTKRPAGAGARPAAGGARPAGAKGTVARKPTSTGRPAGGGQGAGILRFYTDDAPGLKMCVRRGHSRAPLGPARRALTRSAHRRARLRLPAHSGPTTVLVLSLLFIAFVVLLHIWGKFRKG